jgi:hypothetical protein
MDLTNRVLEIISEKIKEVFNDKTISFESYKYAKDMDGNKDHIQEDFEAGANYVLKTISKLLEPTNK